MDLNTLDMLNHGKPLSLIIHIYPTAVPRVSIGVQALLSLSLDNRALEWTQKLKKDFCNSHESQAKVEDCGNVRIEAKSEGLAWIQLYSNQQEL